QGGFAVLKAMAETPIIRGVVAENPYVSLDEVIRDFPSMRWEPSPVRRAALWFVGWRVGISLSKLDVREFAPALGNRPVLLIHGLADTIVSPTQSREIYDALQGPKDLWFVPEGEHEQLWNIAHDAYEARVLRFLDRIATPSAALVAASAAAATATTDT